MISKGDMFVDKKGNRGVIAYLPGEPIGGVYDMNYTARMESSGLLVCLGRRPMIKIIGHKNIIQGESVSTKLSAPHQKKINLLVTLSQTQNAKFKVPVVKMTKRQKELQSAIYDNNFGCSKEAVRKLVEVITGVKIPSREPEYATNLLPLMCFTRTDSDKGPRIVTQVDDRGYSSIRVDETGGYDFPLTSVVKLCNAEETREFLSKVSENILDRKFSQLFLLEGLK